MKLNYGKGKIGKGHLKIAQNKIKHLCKCIDNDSQREYQIFKRTYMKYNFPQIVSALQNVIMTFNSYKNHI